MPQQSIIPVSSSQILSKSSNDLIGQWFNAILLCIVSGLVSMVAGIIPFGGLLIAGPLALGTAIYFLNVSRNKEARFEQLFDGFQNFGTALGAFLLYVLFVLLWSLLFIIPGIIAAYSYAQVFYILVDEPELDAMQALKKSKEMMNGFKMDLFILSLFHFGLAILSLFTFGIALLWLIPFMNTSYANFYNNIKGEEDPLSLEDNLIL